METCVSTDTFCSGHTHEVEDDMIAQVPSDIYSSPVTSIDIETCILTNNVCSTHVASVFIQTQYILREVSLIMTAYLLLEAI